jgi:hypothetical protein
MSKIAIWGLMALLAVGAGSGSVVALPFGVQAPDGQIILVGETSPSSQAETASPDEGGQERYLATQSMEACMNSWDPGTHMTKEAWRTSCERIKQERLPYVQKR